MGEAESAGPREHIQRSSKLRGTEGSRTSAAAAALLRASAGVSPEGPLGEPPPKVRGGPPTLTDLGTEAVPAGAGADPTGRPWPAKLSDEALLQRLPMLCVQSSGLGYVG